jgi:cell wall-associated NlpC family hydrolase
MQTEQELTLAEKFKLIIEEEEAKRKAEAAEASGEIHHGVCIEMNAQKAPAKAAEASKSRISFGDVKKKIAKHIVPVLAVEMAMIFAFSTTIVGTVDDNARLKAATIENTKAVASVSTENISVGKAVTTESTTGAVKQREIKIEEERIAKLGQSTVEYGLQFMGYPYRYGGRDINTGLDCAGFVNWVFTHGPAGKTWTSMSVGGLYNEIGGTHVSVDDMKPGDIIFFGDLSHVAIYAGDGYIIHAMDEANGICKTPLYRGGSTYSGKIIYDVRRVL